MAYYKQLSATAQVKVGLGKLKGILISSTSSGTLVVYDTPDADTSNDPKIIETLTPAAGALYSFPADGIQFSNGLYVVVANTLVFTLIYE